MAVRQAGDWRPSAGREALRARARIVARMRRFLESRELYEVETPLLCGAVASDPHLRSLRADAGATGDTWYLQPSPEAAMKRLLAAGSGSIYQLTRAFRAGESGRLHNPEFTILEWYRTGFDLVRLMEEVEQMFTAVMPWFEPAERIDYGEIFMRHVGLDPFSAETEALRARCREAGLKPSDGAPPRDSCLDFLMSAMVQPAISGTPTFVHGFPASQASLARLHPADPGRADRFELYVRGIELANGYRELLDAREFRQRYARDQNRRAELGLEATPIDRRLLAALEHGLPDCAGVAVGVDRVVMLALGAGSLAEVSAFPADRA